MKFIRDIIGEKRHMSHQANGVSAAKEASSPLKDELLSQSDSAPAVDQQQLEALISDMTIEDVATPAPESAHASEPQQNKVEDFSGSLANFFVDQDVASCDVEEDGADEQPVVSWIAEPKYRIPEISETAQDGKVDCAAPVVQPPLEQSVDPVERTPAATSPFHHDTSEMDQETPVASPEPPQAMPQPTPKAQDAFQAVDVPQPAVGRQGRVKTRLLGFSSSQDADIDPITGGADAKPAAHTNFPLGWLIVVAGPGRGAAFTLFNGVSKIGRGKDQTVPLDFGDNSISRENHAAIAYDPAKKIFFIGHGGKANLVRRNDRPVLSTEELSAGDEITIGETMLRFVPLCGADFTWEESKERDWSHASNG
ncbi:hypothetical protein ROG8370_03615 [Roseovarius gaetbuli]|uniref:FHA domain-containing protein n=1 Tax=Roseovarius gaetbuli TaxID=1356575 RepID=A0A1X7A9K2_9RHOB|nr:FHA domain-containing protein [Roseovarius gaetbuli]SLN73658.1 hypothetical protein ROG8370_03615 [Roseovarius gaetbuli]